MDIEAKVTSLIKEPLSNLNLELVSVVYEKEDKNYFLRIVIDNETGVDLDICLGATKLINKILDEVDLTKDQYILDICSKEKGGDEHGC